MKLRSNAGNEQNESQTGKPRIHNLYKKQWTTAATIASFWLLQLQVLGIFIFTLIVTSGAPFKVLDHAIFEFTVCGMWACSWEINLEPVCQKKNFPLISRGSSCYKYAQERSPRFFASSHVKIKGHAFPTSDVSWSCDRILRGIVERDVLFCYFFSVNSAHFDLFTVAKVCQLHTFSFSSKIRYLQVGIAYGSCLY